MTKKLFWENMYTREFSATVRSVEGNQVILDQTAFNPRGGGLVSDRGTLGGERVLEAVKEAEEVVHVLEGPLRFAANEQVRGVLDWDRRYRIMKMHTGAHVLSAVVNRETGALITGNQIAPDESRVDFSLDSFDREKLSDYISSVNEILGRGLEVKTYFLKREEALAMPGLVKLANATPPDVDMLRIVQIGDVDAQADGGVHVKNTGEIGQLRITRTENKGKSNRRLYFAVG